MKMFGCFVFCFVFSIVLINAQDADSVKLPPAVKNAAKSYRSKVNIARKTYLKSVKRAKKDYIAILKREMAAQTRRGKLDEALKIKALIKELSKKPEDPGKAVAGLSEGAFDFLNDSMDGDKINLLKGGKKKWKIQKGNFDISRSNVVAEGGEQHTRIYRDISKKPFTLECEMIGKGHDKIIWIGDTSVVFRPCHSNYNDIMIGDGDRFGSILRQKVDSYDLSKDARGNRDIAPQKVKIKVTRKKLEVDINGKKAAEVEGKYLTDKIGFGVWHGCQTMEFKSFNLSY